MKIAIASGKGGTGKTTLSTNLTSFLSSKGEKVVLSDLDVEEPNSALFFDLSPYHQEDKFKMIPTWESEKCTLCGHCVEVCNFNAIIKIAEEIIVFPELCHSCYACSELCPTDSLPMEPKPMGKLTHYKVEDKFDVIESRLNIGEEQATSLIAQTIEYVDERFGDEYIKIFDSPPGTSCPVIEAVKDSDYVILISEPTPFGLNDLKLAVGVVKQLGKKMGVVINRYGLGNDEIIKYCKDEGVEIIAKIPNSKSIAKLYSKGSLIYKEVKEFRNELEKIEAKIKSLRSEL